MLNHFTEEEMCQADILLDRTYENRDELCDIIDMPAIKCASVRICCVSGLEPNPIVAELVQAALMLGIQIGKSNQQY